jgi:uncharacterized delta-60 repeat protein
LRFAGILLSLLLTGLVLPLSGARAAALGTAGSPDRTFGVNGLVKTSFGTSPLEGRAMAIQPDGKIVVAGDCNCGGVAEFLVLRYQTDGSLDPTFGSGGEVFVTFPIGPSAAWAVKVQPDGKIVVGGGAGSDYTSAPFALARLNADGSLDSTFGTGGEVITTIPGRGAAVYSLALQPDGKIVACGYSWDSLTPGGTKVQFALARYNSDGSLDNGFGISGLVGTTVQAIGGSSGGPFNNAVAIEQNGDLVVGGTYTGSKEEFAVARYLPNGELDPTFGSSGLVITGFGTLWVEGHAVAAQPNGKIVVSGDGSGGIISSPAVARYNVNGTLDDSFGVNGLIRDRSYSGDSFPGNSIALQSDDKLLISGGGSIFRYTRHGTLDPSFGSNGHVFVKIPSIMAGGIEPDGRLVVAGTTLDSVSAVMVARYNTATPTRVSVAAPSSVSAGTSIAITGAVASLDAGCLRDAKVSLLDAGVVVATKGTGPRGSFGFTLRVHSSTTIRVRYLPTTYCSASASRALFIQAT